MAWVALALVPRPRRHEAEDDLSKVGSTRGPPEDHRPALVRRSVGPSGDEPQGFVPPQKTMDSAGRREAFAPAPLGSPAPCANAIPPSAWQFPLWSSPTRPPAAILPCWNSSSRQLHTRNPPRFV